MIFWRLIRRHIHHCLAGIGIRLHCGFDKSLGKYSYFPKIKYGTYLSETPYMYPGGIRVLFELDTSCVFQIPG